MAAAKDESERTFIASKHCTAAWNGDVSYFESLDAAGQHALADTGYWLYNTSDESAGRQVLVYRHDQKQYTLVPVADLRPVEHDTRLEPLFFAVANNRVAVVRFLLGLCPASPTLSKVSTEPQFVTTVRTEPDATASAAAGTASATAAPAYKYSLLLDGAASRPVTPLQMAIVNGHTQVAALLQNSTKPPENCRSCEGSECSVM